MAKKESLQKPLGLLCFPMEARKQLQAIMLHNETIELLCIIFKHDHIRMKSAKSVAVFAEYCPTPYTNRPRRVRIRYVYPTFPCFGVVIYIRILSA